MGFSESARWTKPTGHPDAKASSSEQLELGLAESVPPVDPVSSQDIDAAAEDQGTRSSKGKPSSKG